MGLVLNSQRYVGSLVDADEMEAFFAPRTTAVEMPQITTPVDLGMVPDESRKAAPAVGSVPVPAPAPAPLGASPLDGSPR